MFTQASTGPGSKSHPAWFQGTSVLFIWKYINLFPLSTMVNLYIGHVHPLTHSKFSKIEYINTSLRGVKTIRHHLLRNLYEVIEGNVQMLLSAN